LSDHKHDQERKDAIDKGEVIGATVGAIGATGAAIPAVAFTLGLSLLVGPTVGLGVGMKMGGQIANGTHRLLHKKQPSAQNFALDIVSKLLSDLEKRDGGFSKSTFIDDKIASQFIQNFNDMQKIMSEKKPKGAKVKEVTDLKHSEGVQDAAIFHTKRTNRKTLGRGNPLESLTPEKMTAEFERMKAEDAANKGF
jgi:hypothetical protein